MSDQTAALSPTETERMTKRGLRLAQFTVVYNIAEGAIAITVPRRLRVRLRHRVGRLGARGSAPRCPAKERRGG